MFDWFIGFSLLGGFLLLLASAATIPPTDPKSVPEKQFFIPCVALLALGSNGLAAEFDSYWLTLLVALATGYLVRGAVYIYRR